jgi:hypothetical protein
LGDVERSVDSRMVEAFPGFFNSRSDSARSVVTLRTVSL